MSRVAAGEEEAGVLVVEAGGRTRLFESGVCTSVSSFSSSVSRAVLLSDGSHVAVAGRGGEVEVRSVLPRSNKINKSSSVSSCVLALPAWQSDWTSLLYALPALGASRAECRPPSLLTGGRDGTLVCWSLDLGGGAQQSSSAIPVLSLSISDMPLLRAAAVSPDARVLALVYERKIEFFKMLKPSLLHTLPLPEGSKGHFAGCSFASVSKLLVWDDQGGAILVELPASYRALPEPQLGPSTSVSQKNDQFSKRRPFMSASMDNFGSASSHAAAGDIRNMSSPLSASSGRVPNNSSSNTAEFHRARAGVIFQREDSSNSNVVDMTSTVAETSTASVAPGDQSVSEGTAGIVEPEIVAWIVAPASVTSRWVCSAGSGELLFSVWEDGTVALQRAMVGGATKPALLSATDEEKGRSCNVSLLVLLDEACVVLVEASDSGSMRGLLLPERRELWNHTLAHGPGTRVTALWCPPNASPENDQLVSGGSDFRVVVWHAATGTQIHSFSQHSAPIEHLIGPPKRDKRWRNCLLSVGGDAVCVLSLQNYNCQYLLGGHSSVIETVVWREDQDFLVVGCRDGAVFVWELGTGTLVQFGRSERGAASLASGKNLINCRWQSARRGALRIRAHPQLHILSLDLRALLQRGADTKWTAWIVPWQLLPPQLAEETRDALGCSSTDASALECSVLLGRKGNASRSSGGRKWMSSSRLTAVSMLGVMALVFARLRSSSTATMDVAKHKNTLARLAAAVLEGCSRRDVASPSLALLATLWQDTSEPILEAARAVFGSAVEQQTPSQLNASLCLFDNALSEPASTGLVSERFRRVSATVLAAAGQLGVVMEAALSARVTDALVKQVLGTERGPALVAAELLAGRGGGSSPGLLAERLLRMALVGEGGEVPRRALLSLAASDVSAVLAALG